MPKRQHVRTSAHDAGAVRERVTWAPMDGPLPEVRQAIPYWNEGLECIEKLRQLGNSGMALARYEHVFEHASEYA